jgi:uncharacterized protein YcsI (UPF0317 family)
MTQVPLNPADEVPLNPADEVPLKPAHEVPLNPAHEIRLRCRSGSLAYPTSGLAPGHIQANLYILPSAAASHFRSLCARNPVPCPLLGSTPLSATGDPSRLDTAGLITAPGFDVRTDLPLYNIYRDGRLVAQKPNVKEEWTDDHVAFLIGCSFSFEAALAREGLAPRHWEAGGNVPMYKTRRKLDPAGIFTDSCYVVSMRPYRAEDVERVRSVTRPFEGMHGEPVAWGWEGMRELGIEDIGRPEFGEKVEIREGEVPVFWVSGFVSFLCWFTLDDVDLEGAN